MAPLSILYLGCLIRSGRNYLENLNFDGLETLSWSLSMKCLILLVLLLAMMLSNLVYRKEVQSLLEEMISISVL